MEQIICDENGILQKMSGKSVIEFLQNNGRPLIIYGMGMKGQFVLDAMDQLSITVSLIVDSSKKKQGSWVKGRVVCDISEAKKRYPDAIVWITIADLEIREPVEKKVHEMGFSPILTFDIQEPLSEDAYIDIEESYPYILVGSNQYTNDLQKYLEQQDCKIGGIVKDAFFIEELCMDLRKANIVVCEMELWTDTIFWLHEHNIYENIYPYIRGDFGVFRIEKYRFSSVRLRYIVRIFFAALNGMNQQMADEASKKSFQEINYQHVNYLKEHKNRIPEDEKNCRKIAELRRWIQKACLNKTEGDFQPFIVDLEKGNVNIFSYLDFLASIYGCCICYKKKVFIQKVKESVYKIYSSVNEQ